MKWLLFIVCILASASLFAAPKINKEKCTITLDNGKTFPLYGKVEIVESLEDISVKIVNSLADVEVEKVTSLPSKCGQWEFVTSLPDIRIKFVSSLADIEVKFVNSLPGIP
ncbi:MAG: hypothetical protein RR386_08810 [Bacteroidaceae bacterium]